MQKKLIAIAIATILLFAWVCLAGAGVKISVFAKNGPAKALKKWAATGEYLTTKIGQPVEVVPLDFDKIFPTLKAGAVDFFLVNSSMLVTAKIKYGATPIATMINSRQWKALNSFGGVVFTSAYNDKINSFANLKGKKFAAVKKSSFGGWQMSYKEFVDAGIDPFKDFASIVFSGKHDDVVFAVQNEQPRRKRTGYQVCFYTPRGGVLNPCYTINLFMRDIMLPSFLRNNLLAKLIVPVAIALMMIMIISAIAFTVITQKNSSRALDKQVQTSFSEIETAIKKILKTFPNNSTATLNECSKKYQAHLRRTLPVSNRKLPIQCRKIWRVYADKVVRI